MSRLIRTALAIGTALAVGLTAGLATAAPAAADGPVTVPVFAPCATGEITSHWAGSYEPRLFAFAIRIEPCPGTTAGLPPTTAYAVQLFTATHYRTRAFGYSSLTGPTEVSFDDVNRVADRRALCLAYNAAPTSRLACVALDAPTARGVPGSAPIPLTDPRLAVASRGMYGGEINPHCGTCV